MSTGQPESYDLTQQLPDARVANSMTNPTLEVHLRLERYAKWSQEHLNGFPANTLLGRYIIEGEGIFSRGKPSTAMPEDVAITDAAVARLGQIDRKVIKAYYFHWEAVQSLSKKLRMRQREFLNVLKRARWRVSLHIADIESKRT